MRQKFPNTIRPEFRRLLKAYRTYKELAAMLRTSQANVGMMKMRGYMPAKFARQADMMSFGKYKAKMLARRGEIK